MRDVEKGSLSIVIISHQKKKPFHWTLKTKVHMYVHMYTIRVLIYRSFANDEIIVSNSVQSRVPYIF